MAEGSRRHRVKPGEQDYTLLSITHYGDAAGAKDIRDANTGVPDPPPVGVVLNIPDRPPAVDDTPDIASDVGPDEVELRVGGKRFRFWDEVTITRQFDAASTLTFAAGQSDQPEFRRAFRPLTYADLDLLVGGKQLFRGTMMSLDPTTSAQGGRVVSVSGYSRVGVLGDCMMPASSYPLQFKGVKFPVIAQRLAAPFSIVVKADDADVGDVFGRVRLKSTEKILPFLTRLAKQRKLVLADTVAGDLLVRAPPVEGVPVATLREGSPPVTSIAIKTKPQQYFSHITVMRKGARSVSARSHTVINDRISGVVRPITMSSEDTKAASELPAAAEALAGRMLADAVAWSVDVATWRDANGDIWEPGSTVSLYAPGWYVLRETPLIIRQVRLTENATQRAASLELVLPGAFSGVLPERYPWDD